LGATVITSLTETLSSGQDTQIDSVVWGAANGAGEDNRNVGRMAVLLAGLSVTTPATTVNRLCGSSLDAAMHASREIEVGEATLAIAGGSESMTRAPWVLPKSERPFPVGDQALVSTTLGWRLINDRMPAEWTVNLGECNEQLRERFPISRERQDAFALRSQERAAQAWAQGFYDSHVITVPESDLTRDESIRPDTSMDGLAALKPAFRTDGTITAGNASPMSDGAAGVLIGSGDAATLVGGEPIARIASRASVGNDPRSFGIAPVEAANLALDRAGITWSDVGAVELNEAFALQSIACIDSWPVDPDVVNMRGGALAIGHPLAASGARLLATLMYVLRETGQRWGVATMCIGVGQGQAIVMENLQVQSS
jgi:acetyl-CoA acyltransferase